MQLPGLTLRPPSAQEVETKEAAALQQHRQLHAERQAARAPAKALAATLLSRGWRIGQPEISIGKGGPYRSCVCRTARMLYIAQWARASVQHGAGMLAKLLSRTNNASQAHGNRSWMPTVWYGPPCSSIQRACRTMQLKRSTSTMRFLTTSTPCLVRMSSGYRTRMPLDLVLSQQQHEGTHERLQAHVSHSLPLHCGAGPDAPPLVWDTEHQYTRDQLDVYYMSHSGKPISEEQLTEVGPATWRAFATSPQTNADNNTTAAHSASWPSDDLHL